MANDFQQPGTPGDYHWVGGADGGAWISLEMHPLHADLYLLSVLSEGTREVEAEGLFLLQKRGRPGSQRLALDEVQGWDGERLLLSGGSSLAPLSTPLLSFDGVSLQILDSSGRPRRRWGARGRLIRAGLAIDGSRVRVGTLWWALPVAEHSGPPVGEEPETIPVIAATHVSSERPPGGAGEFDPSEAVWWISLVPGAESLGDLDLLKVGPMLLMATEPTP